MEGRSKDDCQVSCLGDWWWKGQVRDRLQEEVEILEVQWGRMVCFLCMWLGAYGTGRQLEETEVWGGVWVEVVDLVMIKITR